MRIVTNGLQIRPMCEEDYRDVLRLYRQLIGKGIGGTEFEFSRIFKGFFNDSGREAYVAAIQSHAIGVVTMYYLDVMHHGGQVASIQELVVTEEFRGRGVGHALLDFVKQKAAERHCRGLEVATDLWQRGTKFYERCGFQGKRQMVAI